MARHTIASLSILIDAQQEQIAALRSMLATQAEEHEALRKEHLLLFTRVNRISCWLDELRPKLSGFGDWARKVNAKLRGTTH